MPHAPTEPLSFQDLILTLQKYWGDKGCALLQPYDVEVGAGTLHPATVLRALGRKPWKAAYVQPSRRPGDGRYGENPNAMYLNFLGYLWVDSGAKVDEGAALIARAFSAQPTDGNIQDSLGWAQYRQGRYDEAVVTLEGAVAKEPANAEINDHLGDAYWRVGRRREAGFQWNRVLTLDPDAERKAGVEKKLAEGLPPAEPLILPLQAAGAASESAPEAAPAADAT